MTGADALVLVEDHGRTRLLTFNRPERLNAVSNPLMEAFTAALQAAAGDEGVHAVVLTGAGRAFCAGADLDDMQQAGKADRSTPKDGRRLFAELQSILESFPKPLVAAVNGLGVGFGFTMLGYCDFAFVGESARLRTPFSQLGLSPEASSSYLFPLRMGWSNAARALMLGEWFSAQDVVDAGLAQKVVVDADLIGTALAFAARFGDCPLQSLVATKALMLEAHLPQIRVLREKENATLASLIGTPANKAAVQAFMQRKS